MLYWFIIVNATTLAGFSKLISVITFSLGIVFNGILGPFVEDLYFRGYLIPRMGSFGRWTPLININNSAQV